MLTPEYYVSRHPDVNEDAPYKLYTEEDTKEILEKTEEFIKWLGKQMKK